MYQFNIEKELLKLLPPIYQDSSFIKYIINSLTIEINLFNEYLQDLLNNLYVDTATWGLDYFEKELGITTDINKSCEERRELIKTKKAGQGTTTIQMIKDTANIYTGGNIDILEENEINKFTIKFIDIKGIPRNLIDFENTIKDIKPAHLNYEIVFFYNVWKFIMDGSLKWVDISTKTWEQISIL